MRPETLLMVVVGGAIALGVLQSIVDSAFAGRRREEQRKAAKPPKFERRRIDERYTIYGRWPFEQHERVRTLVAVPEAGVEIGHAGTVRFVNAADLVEYFIDFDGVRGPAVVFYEGEEWMLEKVPA